MCVCLRYDAIIRLTRKLNAKYREPREVQVATVAILCSLMPTWLPELFKVTYVEKCILSFTAHVVAVVHDHVVFHRFLRLLY